MTQVQFGWLIRSIHSWSANLMIFTAFAHMFSVLFLKAYRKPRELTWVSGVILLFLVMGFGFSGYLLPWNTLAFFATKVGTEITGQAPIVGKPMMIFLRGGEEVTGATLTRFFGFHVAVLPGLATVLILLHVLLVQHLGISIPPKLEAQWIANPSAKREMKFFPNFLLRELMAWSKPIHLCLLRRESSPSGTSSSCSRRSSSSRPECGSSMGRFWVLLRSA
jgi:cytochrome b6